MVRVDAQIMRGARFTVKETQLQAQSTMVWCFQNPIFFWLVANLVELTTTHGHGRTDGLLKLGTGMITETPLLRPLNTPTTGRCLILSMPAVSLSPTLFQSAATIRLSIASIMASTTMITYLISERPVIARKTHVLIHRHPAALIGVVPRATVLKMYVQQIHRSAAHLGLAYGLQRK